MSNAINRDNNQNSDLLSSHVQALGLKWKNYHLYDYFLI